MSWLDDLRRRLDREPSLDADVVCAIIRREWGGERVYIPSRNRPTEVTARDTPKTIQAEHGVARSTAYNWARRWRR